MELGVVINLRSQSAPLFLASKDADGDSVIPTVWYCRALALGSGFVQVLGHELDGALLCAGECGY